MAAGQGTSLKSYLITRLALVVPMVLILLTFGIGLILAIPAGAVAAVGWLVFTVIAAIKASEGIAYRYPITLRLVK